MKYKKSKALYLTVLLLLSTAAFVDKLHSKSDSIEITIPNSVQPQEMSVEFASLNSTINQNKQSNEEDYNIDFESCND